MAAPVTALNEATKQITEISTVEKVTLPVPIHRVAQHYYLYHAPTIRYLRARHHILGGLIGTLPQANQQNLFLGLPLSLLPEEARLLCEKGVGYIVDDVALHEAGVARLRTSDIDRQKRKAFASRHEDLGRQIGESIREDKAREREVAMSNISQKELQKRAKRAEQKKTDSSNEKTQAAESAATLDVESSGRPPAVALSEPKRGTEMAADVHSVTPATFSSLFPNPEPPDTAVIPAAPSSFPLYRYLHDRGYFMHPGLRFGCQYMAYPGDPLRFHSHYLVVSRGWEERVNISTLIGCGRLGTGVKKTFLIGGVEHEERTEDATDDTRGVRAFSIEWGGM